MFLRCDVCGAKECLGKRMAIGYFTVKRAPTQLNDFFDRHDECATKVAYNPDHYSIEYEVGRE
jgi:hypothetical protein